MCNIKKGFLFVVCFSFYFASAQIDTNLILQFDFNKKIIKETNNLTAIKPVGVTFTQDRFGNEDNAIFLLGHLNSYLNLGTSNLVKPKEGTISLWVKFQMKVYAGKGFECNPIILSKNKNGVDFYDAYTLLFNLYNDRISYFSSKDSTKQIAIHSKEPIQINKWFHLVIAYNNYSSSFYLNGKKQGDALKEFETIFSENDSVMIGNIPNKKNERSSCMIVDDITIFHKKISEKDVLALYEAPNPNKTKLLLQEALKYAAWAGILVLIIFIMIGLNKQKLARQKKQYEIENKMNELEIKAIKAQINPHFVSNCLSAIQSLVIQNQTDIAVEYIAKFNKLMREVLAQSSKTFISLAKELEIIKLNVELEQLRFNNRFQFYLTVAHSIDEYETYIPSLITQPIIENAIWHGLLPLKENRQPELNLNIYSQNNLLFIEIIDNGVGRNHAPAKEDSNGTKIITDKMESMNRLMRSNLFTLTILDLKDEKGVPIGTNVKIQLDLKEHLL